MSYAFRINDAEMRVSEYTALCWQIDFDEPFGLDIEPDRWPAKVLLIEAPACEVPIERGETPRHALIRWAREQP